jgi:hypothetical protein
MTNMILSEGCPQLLSKDINNAVAVPGAKLPMILAIPANCRDLGVPHSLYMMYPLLSNPLTRNSIVPRLLCSPHMETRTLRS